MPEQTLKLTVVLSPAAQRVIGSVMGSRGKDAQVRYLRSAMAGEIVNDAISYPGSLSDPDAARHMRAGLAPHDWSIRTHRLIYDPDPTADAPDSGLPEDLLSALKGGALISQDGAVFEAIAEWQKAPSNTASAVPDPERDAK